MNHPILVAALAEDRRRQCSCGAVTHKPNGMCRRLPRSRSLATRAPHGRAVGTASHWTPARVAKARLFGWAASLLQIIGKGAQG